MKVIIGANISMNGKVLLDDIQDHQVPQQEATEYLISTAVRIGNLVIGKNTFESIRQLPDGIQGMFPGVEIVLLSSSPQRTSGIKVAGSPEEAIAYLTEKGFTEIAVGGGTATYNAFLEKDLVTDIYFNIIPVITGSGGVLGTNHQLTTGFNLTEHSLLSDGCMRLNYRKIS